MTFYDVLEAGGEFAALIRDPKSPTRDLLIDRVHGALIAFANWLLTHDRDVIGASLDKAASEARQRNFFRPPPREGGAFNPPAIAR